MKKLLFFVLFFLSMSNFAWGGACDTTLSSDSTSMLNCSNDDELTVNEDVTLSRTGNVAIHGEEQYRVVVITQSFFNRELVLLLIMKVLVQSNQQEDVVL